MFFNVFKKIPWNLAVRSFEIIHLDLSKGFYCFTCWLLGLFCLPPASWHVETRGGGRRGEEREEGEGGWISVHSIGPNTRVIEADCNRTDTRFHLFVLSGQCQHPYELRLQLQSSVQGCLCPGLKHQRRDFMVSPDGAPGCCLPILCLCTGFFFVTIKITFFVCIWANTVNNNIEFVYFDVYIANIYSSNLRHNINFLSNSGRKRGHAAFTDVIVVAAAVTG